MIRYADKALNDVQRLHRRLREASPAAAANFMKQLKDAEAQIALMPASWPLSNNNDTRRYLMRFGRSVYVIHYLEDGANQVIVRLWHGRERRP